MRRRGIVFCFIVVDAFVFLWKGLGGVRCDVLFVLLLKRRHDQATKWAMRELLRWRQRWRRTPACRHWIKVVSLFVLYVVEADCKGGALFLCFIAVDAFVLLWKGRRGVRCDVLFVLLMKRRHDQATHGFF